MSDPPPKKKTFRKDINGLRAWAVVAVILYHFGIPGFDGGFVGVDIFFVISGFLMTGIIISELEKTNSFNVINFYLARARRIIPALLILCIILMALGWFWLPPIDYKALGHHTLSAVSFTSNIKFWREAGYFDITSFNKWLLHTWSLSIEWQFYIILPIILIALWKIRPSRTFIIGMIAIGLAVSFGLSVWISPIKASAAFYLLPTRAWEMLAGGIVFLLSSKFQLKDIKRKILELLGFFLIILSIVFLNSKNIWPGYLAALPVVGTMLVLFADRPSSIFTAASPAQWLGNTSYSLYLYHWPFAVALHYAGLQTNAFAISIALLLTVVTSYASYQLVENTARIKLSKISLRHSLIGFNLALILVALPALWIKLNKGIPGRLPIIIESIFAEADDKNPRMAECHVSSASPVPECVYGGKNLGAIVIGDSHAASFVRSIEKSLPSNDLHVLDWTLSSCPTIFGIKDKTNKSYRCSEFLDLALNKAKKLDNKSPIIIINRTSAYFVGPNEADRTNEVTDPAPYIKNPYATRNSKFYEELSDGIVQSACALSQTHPVYMLRPIPELKINVAQKMGRDALIFNIKSRVSISLAEYKNRHKIVFEAQDKAAKQCGIKILDPIPYLCESSFCYGDKDGVPLYYDDDHLSERGAQVLIPMLKTIFAQSE